MVAFSRSLIQPLLQDAHGQRDHRGFDRSDRIDLVRVAVDVPEMGCPPIEPKELTNRLPQQVLFAQTRPGPAVTEQAIHPATLQQREAL